MALFRVHSVLLCDPVIIGLLNRSFGGYRILEGSMLTDTSNVYVNLKFLGIDDNTPIVLTVFGNYDYNCAIIDYDIIKDANRIIDVSFVNIEKNLNDQLN